MEGCSRAAPIHHRAANTGSGKRDRGAITIHKTIGSLCPSKLPGAEARHPRLQQLGTRGRRGWKHRSRIFSIRFPFPGIGVFSAPPPTEERKKGECRKLGVLRDEEMMNLGRAPTCPPCRTPERCRPRERWRRCRNNSLLVRPRVRVFAFLSIARRAQLWQLTAQGVT